MTIYDDYETIYSIFLSLNQRLSFPAISVLEHGMFASEQMS